MNFGTSLVALGDIFEDLWGCHHESGTWRWHWGTLGYIPWVGGVKGHGGGAINPMEVASPGTSGTSLVAMGTFLRVFGDVPIGGGSMLWRCSPPW